MKCAHSPLTSPLNASASSRIMPTRNRDNYIGSFTILHTPPSKRRNSVILRNEAIHLLKTKKEARSTCPKHIKNEAKMPESIDTQTMPQRNPVPERHMVMTRA
jgi:hypothetical protein